MRWLKGLHAWANKHEWVILLLLVVLVLRVPSLFTPHFYGDEEIYLVMGRAWRMGLPLYTTVFDHKPPLIYIIAGLFPTLMWFRTALLVAMLGQTVLFWELAKRFWAKRPVLSYLSSLVFVLLTTLQWFEGLIANAELFMMIAPVASLLIVWPTPRQKHILKYFLGGLVAGLGLLFKIPVVVDIAAIILFLYIFRAKTFWESVKTIFSPRILVYILGVMIPLAASFVYYFAKGIGPTYLSAVFTDNLGYVSSGSLQTFSLVSTLKNGLVMRAGLLAGFTLFLYLFRKKLDERLVLAGGWLAFSFFGSLLSGRPYPHYLQQPVVPFSLLLPIIFVADSILAWVTIGILALLGILAQRFIGFGAYPLLPIYADHYQLLTRQISYKEYLSRYTNAYRNTVIGNYLQNHLAPEDKIYVWGADATIYNLTNRLPAGGPYIVSFHVQDLKAYDLVIRNLRENHPRYIIMTPDGGPFPELQALLAERYTLATSVDGSEVYLRWR